MTRGEIWWVDFGLAFGSMTLGRCPALIVQNDNFNASDIATTVVVPLTTNICLADYKDDVLPAKNTSLENPRRVFFGRGGNLEKKDFCEFCGRVFCCNWKKRAKMLYSRI